MISIKPRRREASDHRRLATNSTRRALAALAACSFACGGPDPGAVRLASPSFERFASVVEPILEARCANPSCHGSALRPLSLYAPLRHRMDPARLHRPEGCTPDEVRANYQALRGLVPQPFLCKTLPEEEGGCFHRGGAIWSSPQEPGFEALRAWAEGSP